MTKETSKKPTQSKAPKALVHMSLQGKGGVGKSFISTLLAQHFQRKGIIPKCFDTDPINQTFAGYKALNVTELKLTNNFDEINPREFDGLIETFLTVEEDQEFVIDNGSGTYLPLISYMVENQVMEVLSENGHEILFHAVLTGGQAYADTIAGLEKLFKYFPNTKCVIWLNEYFGPVVHDGKNFEETDLCKNNADKIRSIVALPEVRKETFGADIQEMMEQRKTFDEAIDSENFSIMSRQRLKTVSKTIFETMEMAQL